MRLECSVFVDYFACTTRAFSCLYNILRCYWVCVLVLRYSDYLLVTGSVDRSIRVWDWRFTANGPLQVLVGHGYAVKRLKCHPHATRVVGSVSYDMTCCLWDAGPLPNLAPPLLPPLQPSSTSPPTNASSAPNNAPAEVPGHIETRKRGSGLGGFGLGGLMDRGYGQARDFGGRGLAGGQLVCTCGHILVCACAADCLSLHVLICSFWPEVCVGRGNLTVDLCLRGRGVIVSPHSLISCFP